MDSIEDLKRRVSELENKVDVLATSNKLAQDSYSFALSADTSLVIKRIAAATAAGDNGPLKAWNEHQKRLQGVPVRRRAPKGV